MIHELKIKEHYWKDIWNGRKSFEIRKNDRNFKVGDIIRFKPIYENGDLIELEQSIYEKYNRYVITYIFDGGEYGLNKEFCVLAIRQVVSFKEESEPILRVRDLVSVLQNNPLDNVLCTIVDRDENIEYEIRDVLIGGGTGKGISYIDIFKSDVN